MEVRILKYVCMYVNMHESIYVYVSKHVCRETFMIMYLYGHEYIYVYAFMYVGKHA